MKEVLAERLLAEVMGWSPPEIAQERPILQAMAAYKYDEYQQFAPGMRFVESLAQWLEQFVDLAERAIAYEFVKSQLVFISAAEMNHLVTISYPDYIRPLLLQNVATREGMNPYHATHIGKSRAFAIHQRQCLFLGLSDGAHTDVFRRTNRGALSHEQVLQTHEISRGRVENLLDELRVDIDRLSGGSLREDECRFRTIVLLEDFAGSGLSCLLKEEGIWKGKISKLYKEITDSENPVSGLVDLRKLEVMLVLYVASEQAHRHLETAMGEIWSQQGVRACVKVVHLLAREACLGRGSADPMSQLVERYYDPQICDRHIDKGGTDGRYGFADGGLPLVLSHNTPNNSICLLWSYDFCNPRGLFPRVSRHREEL